MIKKESIRNYLAESTLFLHRILIAIFVILLLNGILISNIYYLQIICFEKYRARSNENRIKILPLFPNRGMIYDRNGIPLALNRTIYQLEIIPEKIKDINKTVNDLQSIMDITVEDIMHFEKERKRARRFSSIPIKGNLSEIQHAIFSINQFHFPGVEIKSYQRRYYPYNTILTHAIGYVSKMNLSEIKNFQPKGLLSHSINNYDIGKLGIERYYEPILRGKMGYKEIEVNNYGKIIRQLRKKLPYPGKNIYLTLDIHLQCYVQKLLMNSRGAVIVVDPQDGGILSLVSNPSYNPNLFVEGISKKDYLGLINDENCPLINRVTQGLYPPASTVKPYISVSAMTLGIINKNFSLFDPGWWKLPNSEKRYRDWKRCGHGQINVTKAIEESADTFFYQIAYDLGIDRLSEWMKKFGYGQYTGIDLLEESMGVMPNRDWKKHRFKKPWYQGDTIPVGIGQGYWTATPIQMSKALMALINNGLLRTPHLLLGIQDHEGIKPYKQHSCSQIGDPYSIFWKIVKDGMYGVANRPNGTAYRNFFNAPYKIAAKSGTAQVYSLKKNEFYNAKKVSKKLRDHKLMIAFAPYDKPRVGVVVILENGSGDLTAGSVTRKIMDYIFIQENNLNK
ncbi:peptidoglycan DD-transpeptidase MrdA [Candidatus Schneideria nysicola]|uniref:peptidoglycan DD-transpeptidase MrdA n=1 Tax=Candidatus Schneideria nysicola TaxID=1081631 RepID=UPI001CAA4581|nr:peptidoglycan DD-transpeptidase MrdA [Candidatus Schneideria nysicola]UAJ64850.1 peptidoglycan DD-transpeptidase MrdA [Candidatus Schneideria nysicola]